jgi:hypothetical protein
MGHDGRLLACQHIFKIDPFCAPKNDPAVSSSSIGFY